MRVVAVVVAVMMVMVVVLMEEGEGLSLWCTNNVGSIKIYLSQTSSVVDFFFLFFYSALFCIVSLIT